MKKVFWVITGCSVVFVFFMLTANAFAQEADVWQEKVVELEQRVKALEDYVQKIQPTLDEYSANLLQHVELLVQSETGRVVALNPFSKKFTKIVTNTGVFLISVQEVQKTEDGYSLLFNVGNPNAAIFSGGKLTLKWGKKWDPKAVAMPYEEWRRSLSRGTYAFNGALPPGEWKEVMIDLKPVDAGKFEYLECELEVSSVQLKTPQSNP